MLRKSKLLILMIAFIAVLANWAIAGSEKANEVAANLMNSASQNESTPSSEKESKLFVHGYLTQAYARISDHLLYGIPEDGTADYRTAALQFRYAMTPNDNFVIQFSHERMGKSPATETKDDVELDYIFYEHLFSEKTSLKVGKVQIPRGIFNEIRDVGTLLPFYRPPAALYIESIYTSETVNGFVASHKLSAGSDWDITLDFFYGSYSMLKEIEDIYFPVDVKDVIGAHVWLDTPIDGLRFGFGASHLHAPYILSPPGGPETGWKLFDASAEASMQRFILRSEYLYVDFGDGTYNAYYIQGGVKATDKLIVNAQAEISNIEFLLPFIGNLPLDLNRDYAVGVNYAFMYNLVLKLEMHWVEGLWYEDLPYDYIFYGAPVKTTYGILSLSASF